MSQLSEELHRRCEIFKQGWEETYPGSTFRIMPGFHHKLAKELILAEVSPDEQVECQRVFFANDSFGEFGGHSFQSFVKNFNQFVKRQKAQKVKMWTCEGCHEEMRETMREHHWGSCPALTGDKKQVSEAVESLKTIFHAK